MPVSHDSPQRQTAPRAVQRLATLDVRALDRPAALIFNPHAGAKLGLATNTAGLAGVESALHAAGIPFDPHPTEREGHATELARAAVAEGRQLVIAAGGDGTVAEVAHGLAQTDAVLGVMPLGSIMNVARMLWVPRDLTTAADVIACGRVLTMDLGKVGDRYFLEAAGVGLDAGLFAYFRSLDAGRITTIAAFRGLLRFLRQLGKPRLHLEADGQGLDLRAPMVVAANGPFVGAAYALAPDARIDDGLLEVVAFRGVGVIRMLIYLALVAGGRKLPLPAHTRTLRARTLRVEARRRRPLPVHLDGTAAGVTPVTFEAVPAALKVLVGTPDPGEPCAWEPSVS